MKSKIRFCGRCHGEENYLEVYMACDERKIFKPNCRILENQGNEE